MCMWLSRAYSITFRSIWLPCPSNIKRTRWAAEECTCCWKFCSNWRNVSAFIQPLSQATPMLSWGAPIIRRPFLSIFFLGKWKMVSFCGCSLRHLTIKNVLHCLFHIFIAPFPTPCGSAFELGILTIT